MGSSHSRYVGEGRQTEQSRFEEALKKYALQMERGVSWMNRSSVASASEGEGTVFMTRPSQPKDVLRIHILRENSKRWIVFTNEWEGASSSWGGEVHGHVVRVARAHNFSYQTKGGGYLLSGYANLDAVVKDRMRVWVEDS